MKEKHPFRELLGIKQDDLCLLLRVHKSQLAMFESGKRHLPHEATLKLLTICKHLTNSETKRDYFPETKEESQKIKKFLEGEILDNKKKQTLIENKLRRIKNKYEKAISVLNFADYLESHPAENLNMDMEYVAVLKCRALYTIQANNHLPQAKLQMELDILKLKHETFKRELFQRGNKDSEIVRLVESV